MYLVCPQYTKKREATDMALPDDFSPWEHLHGMLLGAYNGSVERTFTGVPNDDAKSALGGMKLACLLQPDDTVDMTVLRLLLYYFVFKGNLPTPVYGIPVNDYQSEITYRPQIQLHFIEDYSLKLAENKLQRTNSEISFRLMNETSATMNPTKARGWALKVKEFFGSGGGFIWERGTVKVLYKDQHNGLDLRLLVQSESEGIRVIERVLELAGHSFDEHLVTVAKSKKNYPTVPSEQLIYGKERRNPRLRPVTPVRFQRAFMHVHGIPKAICLMDRTGRYSPLVN